MTQDEQASLIGKLVLEQEQKRKCCFSLQIKLFETGEAIQRFGRSVAQSAENGSLTEIPTFDIEDIKKSAAELKEVQTRLGQIDGHLKKLGL